MSYQMLTITLSDRGNHSYFIEEETGNLKLVHGHTARLWPRVPWDADPRAHFTPTPSLGSLLHPQWTRSSCHYAHGLLWSGNTNPSEIVLRDWLHTLQLTFCHDLPGVRGTYRGRETCLCCPLAAKLGVPTRISVTVDRPSQTAPTQKKVDTLPVKENTISWVNGTSICMYYLNEVSIKHLLLYRLNLYRNIRKCSTESMHYTVYDILHLRPQRWVVTGVHRACGLQQLRPWAEFVSFSGGPRPNTSQAQVRWGWVAPYSDSEQLCALRLLPVLSPQREETSSEVHCQRDVERWPTCGRGPGVCSSRAPCSGLSQQHVGSWLALLQKDVAMKEPCV